MFTACTDRSFAFALRLQTFIPPIIVAMPTAVVPPAGAEVTPTVGMTLYQPPLLVTLKYLTPPSKIADVAVAVTPAPTKVSVWVGP